MCLLRLYSIQKRSSIISKTRYRRNISNLRCQASCARHTFSPFSTMDMAERPVIDVNLMMETLRVAQGQNGQSPHVRTFVHTI